MPCRISPEQIDATIAFHGHSCPGLAIGIRAAELALRELDNPKDTEIVAVVETDMCGVDALQFLLGTTMGKGNLIHRDHGKMAFSFFRRETGRGVRALLNPDSRRGMDDEMAELMKKTGSGKATEAEKMRMEELRASLQHRFMTLPLDEMFQVTKMDQGAPRPPGYCRAWSASIAARRPWSRVPAVLPGRRCAFRVFRWLSRKYSF